MLEILSREEMGSLKATVSSQSVSSWKCGHLDTFVQCHNSQRALNLEGNAYFGGRAECFRLGRAAGRVWNLDVRSLYQWIGATHDVPTVLAGVNDREPEGAFKDMSEGYVAIADVTLTTPERAYPYRDPTRGITIWPVGTFQTCLPHPELVDALQKGYVKQWHRIAWYRAAPALRTFMKHLFDIQAYPDLSPSLRQWTKGLANSLVGKLGQRDRKWVDAKTGAVHDVWDAWSARTADHQNQRWRSIADRTQIEQCGGFAVDAVPAIACHVTSAGRLRLLNMLRCAGWENVHYCDTDSVWCNDEGMEALTENGWIEPSTPGFLRVKGEHDVVQFNGIKSYVADGQIVCAGQTADVAPDEFGKVVTYTRVRTAGHTKSKQAPTVRLVRTIRHASNVYKHGVRCADGRVAPHVLC